MSDVTVLLERLNGGDRRAFDELVPLVYQELRYRAARYLTGRIKAHTLPPTALVHEAFMRVIDRNSAWKGSRHFHNALAQVMRQILIGHARANAAAKRGGHLARVDLADVEIAAPVAEDWSDWIGLDEALDRLRSMDDRRYQVVMLRYFADLTDAQVAKELGISEKTVERDWATARAFLLAQLTHHDS